MARLFAVVGLGLLMFGCGRVEVLVHDGDETIKFSAPLSLIKSAIRFSDEGVIELDDLAGVDEHIDIKMLLQELKHNPGVEVAMKQDGTELFLKQQGTDYRFLVIDGDEQVRLTLPARMIDVFDTDQSQIEIADLMDALDDFHGTLLEVTGPNEHVRIRLK